MTERAAQKNTVGLGHTGAARRDVVVSRKWGDFVRCSVLADEKPEAKLKTAHLVLLPDELGCGDGVGKPLRLLQA